MFSRSIGTEKISQVFSVDPLTLLGEISEGLVAFVELEAILVRTEFDIG
jgi:hypothetical protein